MRVNGFILGCVVTTGGTENKDSSAKVNYIRFGFEIL